MRRRRAGELRGVEFIKLSTTPSGGSWRHRLENFSYLMTMWSDFRESGCVGKISPHGIYVKNERIAKRQLDMKDRIEGLNLSTTPLAT